MIKEPPHLGNDKPWMSQLKNWCRTVKDEFERTALRGDNVTTSISSGIVHAHLPPAYAKNFEYLGFDKDALTIQIGEGYVKQIGDGFYHFEEFVLVLTVPPLLTDGTYFIILDLDLSGLWFDDNPLFLFETLPSDDIASNHICFPLYRITLNTGDDDAKNIVVNFDMRNMPTIRGF